MTLDEAIVHCEDVAQQNETLANQYSKKEQNHPVERWDSCEKCAEEHRQLAEWLKDYKRLLEQEPVLDKIRAEIEAKCCITVGEENDGAITLHDVFEIIDKYRTHISGKEKE